MRTEDVMKRLEAANPVGSFDLEHWPTSHRGHEILRRVVSAQVHGAEKRPVRRPLSRTALLAVAVAAAAAIAVLVVPVPQTRRGASAATDVLYAAALVAERQPQSATPLHGYRYTKSEGAARGYYDACSVPSGTSVCPAPPPDDWAFSVLLPIIRETWIASDGSGRLLVRTGEPRFFGPEDESEWEAAGRPQLDRSGRSDESFGPGGLSYTDFSDYSTDPDELYDQIRGKAKGSGPSTDAEMLVLVGDLLRETVAPPDLRAALFRVAARIPGVELVGEVTDPAGRKGTAVARTSDDAGFLNRNELIFDPETSELLTEREVLLERVDWADAEPGTVIGYTTYLSSGVVNSTSQRP